MREFARLYAAIDETNKTNEKVAAMVRYFKVAPSEDAAWAVSFLVGRRPKRLVNSTNLWTWATETANIPGWLFAECYDAVGDLAETMATVLPDEPVEDTRIPLHQWVAERVLPLAQMQPEEQHELLTRSWRELDRQSRFVYNKLITGAFRVGVSQDLVIRALGQVCGVPAPVIAHRLMGAWEPTGEFFERLVGEDSSDTDVSKPYPFCLAHPLDNNAGPEGLGPIGEWHAEWKWDGIRAQLIRRDGQNFVWSRGESLITDRFPEMVEICNALPEGTVLDGEILAWEKGRPMKFMSLQHRIGRKNVSKKMLQDIPAVLVAFDILELEGQDLRERPFSERRAALEGLVDRLNAAAHTAELEVDSRLAADETADLRAQGIQNAHSKLLISARVAAGSWEELHEARSGSRDLNVEGIMLKRLDSPYLVGRKKGLWWKWKIDPLTVDAVLIYAQRGNGKRASLYTDYTFGVWNGEQLVPFAKAYTGLTDEEIRKVDSWVRRNTLEKFGPVRTVKPELVFELGFEGIQLSTRHKSGVAVRFPRILRWRHDKKPPDADNLQSIKEMLIALG